MLTISTDICVFPASDNPLSADIGIAKGTQMVYIYDVGACAEAKDYINALQGEKTVVLSHFHRDHIYNLPYVSYGRLYVGKETLRHTGDGIVVTGPVVIDDGIHIEILPLPSSHAKGSLAMCVNEEYAFVGDGIYAAVASDRKTSDRKISTGRTSDGNTSTGRASDGKASTDRASDGKISDEKASDGKISRCYNAQLLKEEIDVLKSLRCHYLLLSHDRKFIYEKQEIIDELSYWYSKREKGNPYIVIGEETGG